MTAIDGAVGVANGAGLRTEHLAIFLDGLVIN